MGRAEEQIAFWNGAAGERWVAEQRERDAMLEPYGNAAMSAAQIKEGDAVLDVGCGCGTTTLAIADRVGPRGRVHGIDISAPMLARAKELAGSRTNVTFALGDAGAMPVPATDRAFDVLYSRFGVMFFNDPVTTFAHLADTLRPRARFAFVCWRSVAENPWAKLPIDAAVRELGPPADPSDASAPGPFAFADRGRVCGMLEQAGFHDVEAAPFESRVSYGKTASEAAKRVATMGPTARVLAERDEATVARVVARIAIAIARFESPEGIVIPGAAWVVTGRRG